MYKALQASGVALTDHGTVLVTVADEDKAETFPLVKRFYKLGFNIVATEKTAEYLKERGIKTRVYGKTQKMHVKSRKHKYFLLFLKITILHSLMFSFSHVNNKYDHENNKSSYHCIQYRMIIFNIIIQIDIILNQFSAFIADSYNA